MTLQGILVGNHATLYIALVHSCISLTQTVNLIPVQSCASCAYARY